MKQFLDLDDLSDVQLESVLARARHLEGKPHSEALRGKVVGLLFMNPSLRTLASMQAGIGQLGGTSFVISPGAGSWLLETGDGAVMDGGAAEHVREAIPVLAQYADALGVRCFARGVDLAEDLEDGVIKKMAALAPVPFINLESAISHPCQALADWKTLDDCGVPRRGGRFVLSWAYHPKPLAYAVPASVLVMAARRGMQVTVLRPDGYELPESVMARARAVATRSGGSVAEASDRRTGMAGADVLYAKSWGAVNAYGRPEVDALQRAGLRDWCVRESWFAGAAPNARFMHCLPVRRNVKVADEVLDGPRSVVVREAGNRLHVQKALMMEMLVEEAR
jgi:N-acetylornithine carbamoyltransferase